MSQETKGFNSLPPKTAFTLGAVGGVLGLCTLGFFILLGTMVEGGTLSSIFEINGAGSELAAGEPSAAPTPLPTPSEELPATGAPPPITVNDHVRGDANAAITLIEYSDFECPFCKRFHPIMQQIMEQNNGRIRWVYRHFPLSFHANAQKEAEASECAAELGGNDSFWNYTDKIYERTTSNGTGFALDQLVPLAKELGLDENSFRTCLDSGRYAQKVRDMLTTGSAAGITGTPGTFIIKQGEESGLIVPGALPAESVQQMIDSLNI